MTFTSVKCKVKLDNIISSFIVVQSVGFDVSEGTSLIKILLDHFEERSTFRLSGKTICISLEQAK